MSGSWEITAAVYRRMAWQPEPQDVGHTAEEAAAMAILGRFIPAAREESCARVAAGRAPGLVLCDQTGEVRIWYIPIAVYAILLPDLPAAAREDLDLVLEVWDPTTEALVVMWTRSAVQPLWLRANGEMRANKYPLPPAAAAPAPATARPPAPPGPAGEPVPAVRLPADITWRRESRPHGLAYRFHHAELGLLGRLVLTDARGGHTQVQAEVAGHPADPQTALRQSILEPITRDLVAYIETHVGRPPADPPPLSAPPPDIPAPAPADDVVIASQLVTCPTCGGPVALLITAENHIGTLEDHARLMYARIEQVGVPTWIIGPSTPAEAAADVPAEILAVLPLRQAGRRIAPAPFNSGIEALRGAHCPRRPAPPRRRARPVRKPAPDG